MNRSLAFAALLMSAPSSFGWATMQPVGEVSEKGVDIIFVVAALHLRRHEAHDFAQSCFHD